MHVSFDDAKDKFKDKSFDRIIFLESIGFANNIKNTLTSVRKLLKDNGKLYIKTPTFSNTTFEFLKKQLEELRDSSYNYSTHNLICDIKKSGYKNIRL